MSASFKIHPVHPTDASNWARMRHVLWPAPIGEHEQDIEQFFNGNLKEPLAVFLAIDEQEQRIGFIELSIRTYAEGCVTDHIAFIEGLYVIPEARRHGAAAALIAEAEQWGRSQGSTELASDAAIDNESSAALHSATGFIKDGTNRMLQKGPIAHILPFPRSRLSKTPLDLHQLNRYVCDELSNGFSPDHCAKMLKPGAPHITGLFYFCIVC